MKNFNTNTDNNETWLTPPELVKALGKFDLDPRQAIGQPWSHAGKFWTKLDNGLVQPWFGRVWLNPPYGRETFKWVKRLSEHKNGLALIFARTETKGFHKEIWEKAHSVFFFKGRIKFCRIDGTIGDSANAPSCLVSYSKMDSLRIVEAIENKSISGKFVLLDNLSDL